MALSPDANVCPLLSQPTHVVNCLEERCALYVSVMDDGKPAGGQCGLQQISVQLNAVAQLLIGLRRVDSSDERPTTN